MKQFGLRLSAVVLAALMLSSPITVFASSGSFIGPLNTITSIASTVPHNGDVNPYGVAVVKRSVGKLVRGDVLVSNFNNSANLQGTGTTIVEVSPGGKVSLFASIKASALPGACPGGVGLTTALVVLRNGWVIVGSLPTADGSSATAKAGCLIVLNAWGKPVETLSGGQINGPWDMTAAEGEDSAVLFVTNVLNGTVAASPNRVNQGTVVRLVLSDTDTKMPQVVSSTVIGSGFGEITDPSALVIGPTGVALGENGKLYVADTLDNRIASISNPFTRKGSAGTGDTILSGMALMNPLGLATAPNGDLVAANAGDGNLVEVSPSGTQVAVKMVDTTMTGAGTLFGLAITPNQEGVYFVNDGNKTLNLLH
jgi:hypothetical protein